jgi:shikimate kinase
MRTHIYRSVPAIDRPLVLIGLMGVGKTTIGRRLAARLGIEFVDADHEIETAAGMTISEIFEKYGETHFRDGERRVIARLVDGRTKVIATGGGAFMNEMTRALILEKTIAIWIDANIDILAERVARRDTRPLIKGKDPVTVLRDLAALRNPVYALAPIHVRSESAPSEKTVDAILDKLSCASST